VTALALVFAASTANSAFAQDTAADPDAPEFLGTETMPEMGPGRALRDAQDTVRGMVDDLMDQQGMMDGPGDGGMTSPGMMGQGMMCSEMCGDMAGQGTTGSGGMGQGEMGGMMHSGTSDPGMMDHRGMSGGMMEGRMPPGMMGSMAGMGMHGHALRVMFAIADANDDGGLSLEEIADIQARIFGAIDADDDGTMTPEELQAFMQE
jgi:hypothetical protein